MIDREIALEMAQKWFADRISPAAPHLQFAAVAEKEIIETSFAWILPWNDRRYLAGDKRWEVLGHSPLVVMKNDGAMMYLPMLNANERARWGSKQLHGTMEHRIANLAEKLEIKDYARGPG